MGMDRNEKRKAESGGIVKGKGRKEGVEEFVTRYKWPCDNFQVPPSKWSEGSSDYL